MTVKLYDESSYIKSFEATVLSCEEISSGDNTRWAVVLDRTAFFPESGGQAGDTGRIGQAAVLDTQISGGDIIHYTDRPVSTGGAVECYLDWEQRFSRMQNHTGEHICCGIAHRLWGCENVGFHLGSDDVTFDLDKELSEEQIRELELLANKAAVANTAVTAEYPSPEKLAGMTYRSKLELTENVRIVTIEGCDVCACCAPHVSRTGEVGMIKLLEHLRWKGGTRIHLLCGFAALEDYNREYAAADKTGAMLSVQHLRIPEAVEALNARYMEARSEIRELKRRLAEQKLRSVAETEGNIVIFEDDFSIDDLRWLCNNAPRCGGMCACFSQSGDSYLYVISGSETDMRAAAKSINAALSGKGGGSEHMIQGSVKASREEITAYFGGTEGTEK